MSIQTEISRISSAKSDLRQSLSNKGVSVPESSGIEEYHSYVDRLNTLGFVTLTNQASTDLAVIGVDSQSGIGLSVQVINTGSSKDVAVNSLVFCTAPPNVLSQGPGFVFVREEYNWPPYYASGYLYRVYSDFTVTSTGSISEAISDSEALSIITGGTTV